MSPPGPLFKVFLGKVLHNDKALFTTELLMSKQAQGGGVPKEIGSFGFSSFAVRGYNGHVVRTY